MTSGFVTGNSLETDFVDVSYDATSYDARPTEASALVGAADPGYLPADDITGTARTGDNVAGAYDLPAEGAPTPLCGTGWVMLLLFGSGLVVAGKRGLRRARHAQ